MYVGCDESVVCHQNYDMIRHHISLITHHSRNCEFPRTKTKHKTIKETKQTRERHHDFIAYRNYMEVDQPQQRNMAATSTAKSLDPPSNETFSSSIRTNVEVSKDETERHGKLSKTMNAILDPTRLEALLEFDAKLVSYEPFSFLIIFRFQGRNFSMLILPLLLLGLLDVVWWFVFYQVILPNNRIPGIENGKMNEGLKEQVERLDELMSPILVPVSFLLVFRLGRAAVRYVADVFRHLASVGSAWNF